VQKPLRPACLGGLAAFMHQLAAVGLPPPGDADLDGACAFLRRHQGHLSRVERARLAAAFQAWSCPDHGLQLELELEPGGGQQGGKPSWQHKVRSKHAKPAPKQQQQQQQQQARERASPPPRPQQPRKISSGRAGAPLAHTPSRKT
jgi:hypothetical protein